jgi:hypothetical protein
MQEQVRAEAAESALREQRSSAYLPEPSSEAAVVVGHDPLDQLRSDLHEARSKARQVSNENAKLTQRVSELERLSYCNPEADQLGRLATFELERERVVSLQRRDANIVQEQRVAELSSMCDRLQKELSRQTRAASDAERAELELDQLLPLSLSLEFGAARSFLAAARAQIGELTELLEHARTEGSACVWTEGSACVWTEGSACVWTEGSACAHTDGSAGVTPGFREVETADAHELRSVRQQLLRTQASERAWRLASQETLALARSRIEQLETDADRWQVRAELAEQRADGLAKELSDRMAQNNRTKPPAIPAELVAQKESAELRASEMAQQLREMAGQKAEAERRADEAAKQLADLQARTPPRWPDPATALVQSPRSLDVGLTPRGYTRELRSVTQALHPLDSMYHAGDADGYARAVQLYRLAADKGNALAQYVPPTQCERARVCVCVNACV